MSHMEQKIKILKIRKKPQEKGFLVTVPIEAKKTFDIKGGERIEVLFDKRRKRIILRILSQPVRP